MPRGARGRRNDGRTPSGNRPVAANRWVEIAVPTGLGELRNGLMVRAADALIAVGGEWGTLSEIALALKVGKPVIGLESWELGRGGVPGEGMVVARDPEDAVKRALRHALA